MAHLVKKTETDSPTAEEENFKFLTQLFARGSKESVAAYLNKHNRAVDEIFKVGSSHLHPFVWTGLLCACRNMNLEVVEELLRLGANPNLYTNGGLSPLMAVAMGSYEEEASKNVACARMLIDAGASIKRCKQFNHCTVLTRAVRNKASTLVKFFVESGADVNEMDGHGETPFNIAISTLQLATAEFLLDHGANPFKNNLDGTTNAQLAQQKLDVDKEILMTVAGWRLDYYGNNFKTKREFYQMLNRVNSKKAPKPGTSSNGGAKSTATEVAAKSKAPDVGARSKAPEAGAWSKATPVADMGARSNVTNKGAWSKTTNVVARSNVADKGAWSKATPATDTGAMSKATERGAWSKTTNVVARSKATEVAAWSKATPATDTGAMSKATERGAWSKTTNVVARSKATEVAAWSKATPAAGMEPRSKATERGAWSKTTNVVARSKVPEVGACSKATSAKDVGARSKTTNVFFTRRKAPNVAFRSKVTDLKEKEKLVAAKWVAPEKSSLRHDHSVPTGGWQHLADQINKESMRRLKEEIDKKDPKVPRVTPPLVKTGLGTTPSPIVVSANGEFSFPLVPPSRKRQVASRNDGRSETMNQQHAYWILLASALASISMLYYLKSNN